MKWWLALLVVGACVDDTPEEGDLELAVTTFGSCPRLELATVTPLTVAVEQSASIEVIARDVDGDAVLYAWSALDGTFSAPRENITGYRCASPGEKALTLTYSDAPGCSKQTELRITCVP
ncbi:MAG TPA: hypothetical protein VFX59_01005 [Polyangiales bacterium]|nr:hypothetical protein [Polyangiales bacterium]